MNWNCWTIAIPLLIGIVWAIDLKRCLWIGIAQTTDYGDWPLIGIIQQIDFGAGPIVGTIRTIIDFGCCPRRAEIAQSFDFGRYLLTGLVCTIAFGFCLLNGIVQTIDFGCCELNGIVQTDFGDWKVVGTVRTINFRCRARNQLLDKCHGRVPINCIMIRHSQLKWYYS